MDSNSQSQDLTNEIEKLASLIEKTKLDSKKATEIIEGIKIKLKANNSFFECRKHLNIIANSLLPGTQ